MSELQTNEQDSLLDGLLGDFLDESDQLLVLLNERLLQLDEWVRSPVEGSRGTCDPTVLNEMFRAAHSLKGLSAMLGLSDINQLTHKIENVFDAARKDELPVSSDVTELVFRGLDRLTAMIEHLKEPTTEAVDSSAVTDDIRRLLQTAGVERQRTSQADAEKAFAVAASDGGPDATTSIDIDGAGSVATDNTDPMLDVADETDIPERYLSIFIDESEVTLDSLTSSLLSAEGGNSGDYLHELMGGAHKIKGSAASIGLNRIAKLAHLMEDLLEELIDSNQALSPTVTDVLLRCTGALQQHISDCTRGNQHSDNFASFARELLAARKAIDAVHAGDGLISAGTANTIYAGEVIFQPGLAHAGLKAELIYTKLSRIGMLKECEPSAEQLESIESLDRFRFQIETDRSLNIVKEQMRISGVCEIVLEALAASPQVQQNIDGENSPPPIEVSAVASSPAATEPQTLQSTEPRTGEGSHRPTETVRVDIERLDHLMDLAGQLVIQKAQFAQIGERLRGSLGGKRSTHALNRVAAELERMSACAARQDGEHTAGALDGVRNHIRRIQKELEPLRREIKAFERSHEYVESLFEAVHQFGRVSDAVQQSVMDTRMVPIGPLFARFKRVVRDINRSSGKEARLDIRGENTELDKRMIDELGDPLVHLVRNSVDHGIESPEAREAAGKPRQGNVTLDAFHRGNSIVIAVRDDGKGLDAERILRKCLEKGLVSPADAEKLTPQQIYQKIWEPGLSTADKITEVSGRGMGMDIVKSKIEELSGTVDIDSTPGQGTTITLKLPLTLAILPSLLVEIRGEVFAIPMESVAEIVSIRRGQVSSVQGRQMACVRGKTLSMLRLDELLDFHAGHAATPPQSQDTTLVIVGEEGGEVGLAVDRVLGEENIVIKSIAENFENIRGIAGASILGDGRVSLILDIPGLVDMLLSKAANNPR